MRPLQPDEVVTDDVVLGLYMVGDFDWFPPPVDMVSRDSLWYGSSLVVPPPTGEAVRTPTAAVQASVELAEILGGPFEHDLTPFIRVLGNLAFSNPDHPLPSQRHRIFHDRPGVIYTYLSSAFDRWRVQALGAPGDFYFVSLFTTLDEGSALDAPGGLSADERTSDLAYPRTHPLGEPWTLLTRVAPALVHRRFEVDTRYPNNQYDAVFVADRLRVRTGVRLVCGRDGGSTGEYLYVVRVDTRTRELTRNRQ